VVPILANIYYLFDASLFSCLVDDIGACYVPSIHLSSKTSPVINECHLNCVSRSESVDKRTN
jgi:hypothetical protein